MNNHSIAEALDIPVTDNAVWPTGWEPLSKILDGGLKRDELIVFAPPLPGQVKTMFPYHHHEIDSMAEYLSRRRQLSRMTMSDMYNALARLFTSTAAYKDCSVMADRFSKITFPRKRVDIVSKMRFKFHVSARRRTGAYKAFKKTHGMI